MRRTSLTGAMVALGFALLTPASAEAFCRTWSCSPATTSCPPDPDNPLCPFGGIEGTHFPLYWPQKCIGFSMNERVTAQLYNYESGASAQEALYDAQLRFSKVLNKAFATWQNVDCGGGQTPSLAFANLGLVTCDKQEFNQKVAEQRNVAQGNANIIMFHDDVWPYEGSANTLGLTTIVFNARTGEIYDADMELNGVESEVKLTTTDTPGENDTDLLSVLTHEVGHFLGIGHSPVKEATMYALYTPGSTSMRTLDDDDKAAVCAIYPPTRVGLPVCNPTPRHGYSTECGSPSEEPKTCSMRAAGAPAGGVGLLALSTAVTAMLLRRRRSAVRG